MVFKALGNKLGMKIWKEVNEAVFSRCRYLNFLLFKSSTLWSFDIKKFSAKDMNDNTRREVFFLGIFKDEDEEEVCLI